MISIFVLVVFTTVHGGSTIAFQEFNSNSQCEYVAQAVKRSPDVTRAWCVKK